MNPGKKRDRVRPPQAISPARETASRIRLACGVALLLASVPARGQTTGNIEGTITDISGVPLPGVAVEATSAKLPGARVGTSDTEGRYRILAVPPGEYRLRASPEAFETKEETVTVSLDATTRLDMKLKLAIREDVTVSGTVPLVDLTSTTSGTTYTNRVISKLPVARNYADIVRANPGVNTDQGDTQGRSLALTIYGATSVENQWIIDGVNTTNVIKGFQGKAINNEFIDEVEVKTGGYQAEYGRALGGIINVITKSGGNDFRGDAFAYFDSKGTRATQIVTRDDSLRGMRITPTRRWDYGVDLGGYLLKDRLWFFAAYDRVDTPGTASRFNSSPDVPNTLLFPRDQTDSLYSGKLTWNISSAATLVATAFSDPSRIDGAARVGTGGGGLISSPDPGTWETRREIGGLDGGLRFSQLFGSRALLTAQVSRHQDRFELFASGAGAAVREEDWTCAGGTPDNPCEIPIEPNSVTGGIGAFGGSEQKNRSRRDQYRADLAYYAGNHEIKVGGDYQRGTTTSISAFSGGQAVQKFNELGQTYYAHFFYARSLTDLAPISNVNEARSSDFGLYLQDSWKALPSVTVDVGLRWDEQRMFNSVGDRVFETTAEWQPRLGVVWDPGRDGKTKIYASAGRSYFSLPTALSIFSYGTSIFAITYNFDPRDKSQDPSVVGHETPFVSADGFAEPVDAGLKGIYQDELTIGIERAVGSTASVGLKATYRRLGRSIEDRCDLDPSAPENNFSSCAIINPGSGGKYARGDFPSCNGLDGEFFQCQQGAPATPPARRFYRGIEVIGRKSIADRLWLQASYVYSSLRGNQDGFVNEDFVNTLPGVSADFDSSYFFRHDSGRLFLDRTHSFRLDASCTTAFGLFGGVQAYLQSGAPLSRLGYFDENYGAAIYLVPRGTARTLPTLWEASATIGYPVVVGPVTVTAQLYAFNLFNNQIETQENIDYTVRPPAGYPGTLYDPSVPSNNPNYGKILKRQDPRSLRFALRVSF